jgi:hypothetical protein
MNDIKLETIKVRINSLGSTRVLFSFIFTVISGIFLLYLNLTKGSPIPYNYIELIVLLFICTSVGTILGFFSLTDAIHNYSKYLEYSSILKQDCEPEKSLLRAMSADNYSYGILRWTLIFLFGLVIFIAGSFQTKINFWILTGCWTIASLFLLRCYAISHYPVKPKTIWKFFYFGQAYENWEKQIKDAICQK